MKIFCVVALALCAFAHADISVDTFQGEGIEASLGPQELHLHAASEVVSDDDQLLVSKALAEFEQVQGRNLVADAIKNFLESFRETVINGNHALPPLDPLHIAQIGPFEYTATGVRVTFNVNNFNMEGLRWYVVDYVNFNTLRLAIGVKVTIPWMVFTGRYDASARITLISHVAGGNFRIFVNRLETVVDIRVGTNILGGGTLILRQLDIDIMIHDVSIQIQGMVGSSVLNNLINAFVQNAAQNLLKDQLETVSQTLSRELFDVINDFLANFTLDDLLG